MKQGPKNTPNKSNSFLVLIVIAFLLALLAVFSGGNGTDFFSSEKKVKIPLSVLLDKYGNDEFVDLKIKESEISGVTKAGEHFLARRQPRELLLNLIELRLDRIHGLALLAVANPEFIFSI